jgi:hypothetical protein
MWHPIARALPPNNGAAVSAAPLYVHGIKLRATYANYQYDHPEGILGKLDTGSAITVIPLSVALLLKLESAGVQPSVQSIDHSIQFPEYPKFKVTMFIPGWGWKKDLEVMACERDTILLGRDVCDQMLLIANWNACGFGVKLARYWHRRFQLNFCSALMPKRVRNE